MATINYTVNAIDSASEVFRRIAGSADDVVAKIDDLSHKSATARVGLAGDKEASLSIADIELKLARLGKKAANPNVTVEGLASAQLGIMRLSLALDKLNAKHARPDVSTGFLSRILGRGGGPGVGSLSAIAQLITGAVPAAASVAGAGGSTVSSGAGSAAGSFAGSPAGLIAMAASIPLIEAAAVDVTGLVSGLAAAAAGVGAFGLLAVPTFKAVTTAYTGITAAQKAYAGALALQKADPTAAHAKAAELALDKLQIAQQNQPPMILRIVSGVQGLVTQFDRMAKVMQPDILKVFNLGLKTATEVLPVLLPLAQAAAPAIEGLLKQMAGFFKLSTTTTSDQMGPGHKIREIVSTTLTPFGEFMKKITSFAGPAITAIGEGLGHVATSLGKLLTIMSKKDVVNAINIAFSILTGTINVVIFMVRRLMQNWDAFTSMFDRSRKIFDTWRHATGVIFDRWRHDVAAIFDGVRHDTAHVWDMIFRDTIGRVQRGVADVNGFFRRLPGQILGALSTLGTGLKALGSNALTGFLNGVRSAWAAVSSWFAGLPSRIAGAIGDLGRALWSAGAAVIDGLWAGMRSAFGPVAGWLSSLGGVISHLKGPLDYDATLLVPHGLAIMGGLRAGLAAGWPGVEAQLTGVTAAIAGYAYPVPALGGGPSGTRYAGGGGNTYVSNYTVNVAPTPLAHPADIGREVIGAIKEAERRSGAGWRRAAGSVTVPSVPGTYPVTVTGIA